MIDCSNDRWNYREEAHLNRAQQIRSVTKIIDSMEKPFSYEELLEINNDIGINVYRYAAMVRNFMYNPPWPYTPKFKN